MSSQTWYQSGCGEEEEDPLVSCKLCLGDVPSGHMTTISQCRCVFCTPCLKRYVELLLSEGLEPELSCPDAACPEQGLLLDTEIEAVVDPDRMKRYRRLRFEREVLLDPSQTWCPAPSCQAVCQLTGAEAYPAPRDVCCPACRLEFCFSCRAQRHRGRACLDAGAGTFGGFLSGESSAPLPVEGGPDDPVKRCPKCRDDFLLIHYDKGPCRNKLGHSRASVIWHRTQVVGMVAGFGVILLATSPFLLLATPLLFCCTWKYNRRDDDTLPTVRPPAARPSGGHI
ncbi:hypothetical protein NHX12_026482 [Muraenolepis orangiensis]|uniref:RBR-type E3 ubiquitin transferase n=1 Tax=Muraenolepis orangiensis TaxID=630683 RepID=A0A9Q0EHK3_9TELE|nr:hypothetical protein NHX12_026482 [Muraenolepis orangiensis]